MIIEFSTSLMPKKANVVHNFHSTQFGGYFQLMSAEVSLKISYNYPQIESSKDRAKHETVLKINGL